MITLTDAQEKQILFVDPRSEEGKFGLRFANGNLVLLRNEKATDKISVHRLLAVFVLGDLTLTSKLIEKTKEHGVSLFLLKRNFLPYATLHSEAEGNYLARKRQYTLSEKEELELARFLVKNKLKNQARLLKKIKDENFKKVLEKVSKTESRQELLGLEGNFAKEFFSEYFAPLGWRRRAPRTREDIPNLLLDIGYTVLFNFVEAMLRLHGLDVYKGVYHRLFFARKSLVTDVEEPLRCLVDKALLKAHKLGKIRQDDFAFNKRKGEFYLPWKNSSHYYRIFSEELMERKVEIYEFVRAFYRHIMLPEKNKLKEFNINKSYSKK